MASDFEARLAALESQPIGLRDLPMAALMRKLESDWQPDASTLLQGGSITIDALSAALTFRAGTLTYPGASQYTTVLTVTHGLGRTPTVVLLTPTGDNISLYFDTLTPTTFNVTGMTNDGSSPAAATTRGFGWLVL